MIIPCASNLPTSPTEPSFRRRNDGSDGRALSHDVQGGQAPTSIETSSAGSSMRGGVSLKATPRFAAANLATKLMQFGRPCRKVHKIFSSRRHGGLPWI